MVISSCAADQERIERERRKEQVPLDLFAAPEKLSATDNAPEVAEVRRKERRPLLPVRVLSVFLCTFVERSVALLYSGPG